MRVEEIAYQIVLAFAGYRIILSYPPVKALFEIQKKWQPAKEGLK